MRPADRYREEDDSRTSIETGAWMSLLDRLLYNPASVAEAGARRRDPLSASIERDLAELLSARYREETIPNEYEEAARSILNFGIPRISGSSNLASPLEQNKLCKSMEEAVRTFEPRLSKVSMRVADPGKGKTALRFRLEANIDALSERHVFEFDFTSDTGLISVAGGNG